MSIYEPAIFQNINFFLVGLVDTAILILGIAVFFNNRKSITHRTFLLFSLVAGVYIVLNYFSTQSDSPVLALWILRFVIFFAVWYSYFLFQLFYVFPRENVKLSVIYKLLLLPAVVCTSVLTLTPFVFSEVAYFSSAGVPVAELGPAAPIFGFVASYLVFGGMVVLSKKTRRATGIERRQFELVLFGALITYSFIVAFNLILPLAFDNTSLIPLAPIFTFPFVLFTTYAIVKHHLFDIKVLATEILVFILSVATLLEVFLAEDAISLIFRVAIFFLVLFFGVFLIRSVRKEVHQREELQKLTDKLALANQNLVKLDKAKTEFVSIASHQLRTPLTAIKGYMSLILEGSYGKAPRKIQEPMKKIYESNERLIHLVNDLLNISRIQSGKTDMEWEQVDIEKLVEEVIEEMQVKAKEKKIKLRLQKLKDSFPLIRADREKLRNVLLNIVDNGIRYTENGGITISADRTDGHVLVEIKDTGEGMTKDELDSMFESFTRGKAGQRMWTEGTGLGLYIAKQFVEMHKGRIWATSEGKGKGSTFFIELPITQEQHAQNSASSQEHSQREGSYV